jgi:putative ABC transport system permease protein
MIPWKLSLREIVSHRMRAVLTASSIVVGVAAILAVQLAVAAVRQSFGAMQSTVSGSAALEVDAADGGMFPQEEAARLSTVPGVAMATPVFQRLTVMYFGDRRATVLLSGVDSSGGLLEREYAVSEGAMFANANDVLLDAAFARSAGLRVNDTVRFLTRRGRMIAKVVGLVQPRTGAAITRGGVAYMPLSSVQRQFSARGQINRVQLILEDQVDPAAVQVRASEHLPPGLNIHAPSVLSQMGEETMMFFQKAMQMSAYFVLLAAVFIVANAFFMNVAQRRRQLALMRAIGATRRQIRFLVLREAATLAAVATGVGVIVGWGGAVLLSQGMGQLFGTRLPPPELSSLAVGSAILFGLGVSLLGAVLPAERAAQITPLEGMHEVSHADREGVPVLLILIGAISFPICAALLILHLTGLLPQYHAPQGAVLLLVSLVPLFGLALRPGSRIVAFLLQPWVGPELKLARRQLLSRQIRTVLTIGVLFVVSSTGVGLANTVLDNIQDIQDWYRRAMTGDFFLRAMTPDLASWELVELPEETETQTRAIPGIETMYAVRFVRGEAAGQSVMIIAREYETDDTIGVDPHIVAPPLMRRKFHEGEVTIGSVLAERSGLGPGDTIEIQTRQGPRQFPIAAIENDYMAGGLTIHMERGVARRMLDIRGADVFVVRAKPESRASVQSALQRIANEHGLMLQSYAEVTGMIDRMQSGVIGGLWAVLVLGLLVAAMGATNTLSMNVWEQTRELAMLRVVAMTRRQARRTIFAQAIILGAVGLAPGVLAGLGLAWVINQSLAEAIGHPVTYGFRPLLSLAAFSVAMLLVLFAAWMPARRAVQVDPIDALRYE